MQCIVRGVAKSQIRLGVFHFHFSFEALEGKSKGNNDAIKFFIKVLWTLKLLPNPHTHLFRYLLSSQKSSLGYIF